AISKDYPLIGRAAATIKATLAKHPQACVALHGGGAVELGARLEGATLAIGSQRSPAVGRLVFWAGTPDSTHTLLSLWRARPVGKLLAFGPQGERLPSERSSPPPPRSQPERHREPAGGGRFR
ncbi:MAG TPA: hypothetical protein VNL71_16065, partial [Chloroflexota bacterium]|nr:hypothetical protein [Chloroflexota bacterium]